MRQWGEEGPAVLLHHATGLCKDVWREIAEPLAGKARLFAYDVRGHGDSDLPARELSWERYGADLAQVASALVERTGQPFALVVGHSLGGIAALEAMEQVPEQLPRGLLLDPVLIDAEEGKQRKGERRRIAVLTRMRRTQFDGAEQAFEELRGQELYTTWSEASLRDYLGGGLREQDGQWTLKCAPTTEAAIYQLGETTILSRLPDLAPRAELLVSHVSPFSRAYGWLGEHVPSFGLNTLETGHMIPMEAPETVREAIQGALGD